LIPHLLGERICYCLRDQRLTTAGRSVEQDALWWAERIIAVELGVQERKLDGITDLRDLRIQSADILKGDIRDLLQLELRDLGFMNVLQNNASAIINQNRIAGAYRIA